MMIFLLVCNNRQSFSLNCSCRNWLDPTVNLLLSNFRRGGGRVSEFAGFQAIGQTLENSCQFWKILYVHHFQASVLRYSFPPCFCYVLFGNGQQSPLYLENSSQF